MQDDLIDLLDLLQTASTGSAALDARIGVALADWIANEPQGEDGPGAPGAAKCWSEDLMALLRLVPRDHNFSLGERDGVLWAWIQPNDKWAPSANEMRHDHPRGSGLILARTLPLAVTAALVVLRAAHTRP